MSGLDSAEKVLGLSCSYPNNSGPCGADALWWHPDPTDPVSRLARCSMHVPAGWWTKDSSGRAVQETASLAGTPRACGHVFSWGEVCNDDPRHEWSHDYREGQHHPRVEGDEPEEIRNARFLIESWIRGNSLESMARAGNKLAQFMIAKGPLAFVAPGFSVGDSTTVKLEDLAPEDPAEGVDKKHAGKFLALCQRGQTPIGFVGEGGVVYHSGHVVLTDADTDSLEPDPAEVLTLAKAAVFGKRRDDYGTPLANHDRTAKLWAAYLGHPVTAEDVCFMNVLQKVSRSATGQITQDTLVDIAGYALNVDLVQKERGSK